MLARRSSTVERRSVVGAYASSVLLFQVTSHCRDESGRFPIVIARARSESATDRRAIESQ